MFMPMNGVNISEGVIAGKLCRLQIVLCVSDALPMMMDVWSMAALIWWYIQC